MMEENDRGTWSAITNNINQLEFLLSLVNPNSEHYRQAQKIQELNKRQLLVLFNADTEEVLKETAAKAPATKRGRGRKTGQIRKEGITNEQIVEVLSRLINEHYDKASATMTTPNRAVAAKNFFVCVYAYLIYMKIFDKSYSLNAFTTTHLQKAFKASSYPDAYVNYYKPMNDVIKEWNEIYGTDSLAKDRKLIYEISLTGIFDKKDKMTIKTWRELFREVEEMMSDLMMSD